MKPIFEKTFDKLAVTKEDKTEERKEIEFGLGLVDKFKDSNFPTKAHLKPSMIYSKKWIFKNDFGISVVRGFGTYGSEKKLFEIAVLYKGELHFNNPIANGDVKGYLTEKDVLKIGKKIANLSILDFL